MAKIHPTAIVDAAAQIASDVEVGPYSIIGPKVTLESGVKIWSHVCIEGHTTVGENTQIYPFCIIGFPPPDLKYHGEDSRLVIGKNNVIREHVTIHVGTAADRMETTIGDNNLLMANAHIAHDCVIENNVIMANCATLGGHVRVCEGAIIGGLAAVHQRVKIGAYAIVGGMSGVVGDIIPYGSAAGERAKLIGLNVIGLKRKQFTNEQIMNMNKAYKMLFDDQDDVLEARMNAVASQFGSDPHVMQIIEFIRSDTGRLCKPHSSNELNAA